MKRILTFATAVLAIGFCGFTQNASAGDHYYGGHHRGHGYNTHHSAGNGYSPYGRRNYGSNYGGYGRGPVQSYAPQYGYGHGGGGYGVTPSYGRTYSPSYSSPNHSAPRGGIHLDIGRFHVLGLGGHH